MADEEALEVTAGAVIGDVGAVVVAAGDEAAADNDQSAWVTREDHSWNNDGPVGEVLLTGGTHVGDGDFNVRAHVHVHVLGTAQMLELRIFFATSSSAW